MKIPGSIRTLYEEQYETNNDKLKPLVDNKIRSLKDERWHYESRLKSLESYALKIESGRIDKPSKLEDFFACTLVVENKTAIRKAEDLVKRIFQVQERRPPADNWTAKRSDAFPFDDLRLYVKWKDNPALPPSDASAIVFEIQIKTFLQHAWSIATHDLIYKSDDVSWAKERIAYQIKAMLEHAEMSIYEAEKLAASAQLKKLNKHTDKMLKTLKFIKESWDVDALPRNIVLLASNTLSLMEALNIDMAALKKILRDETKAGKGLKTLNLSPYGIIIQSLVNREPARLVDYLSSGSGTFKVLIPKEIDLPEIADKGVLRNAIFV
jgi:hypothetical protein